MYRNEHQTENVTSGVLASHRSLPDQERSIVARASYERESVTERRVKKKTVAGAKKNSLPRLPHR